MRTQNLTRSILVALLIFQGGLAQQHTLKIEASKKLSEIAPTMYGIFFEDINFAADGGIYAELVKNRSFEFPLPKMGWQEPHSDRHTLNKDSGMTTVIQYLDDPVNKRYLEVQVNNDKGYELHNEGFRGMGIKANARYLFSLKAARPQGITTIIAELINPEGTIVGSTSLSFEENDWNYLENTFVATQTAEKATLRLRFKGKGSVALDMISLFPEDTWKGRKKGLRKDLVERLEELNPGFLRFPGGCIVEGRNLAQRYQWKKTVGPVEERENLINRWNTEFNHRLTPDYFQSFGLGFYEYFLLSEDLGAEALPILGCGMACQFNTGELVPMEELDPYIQDALDLIEFANGNQDTQWGSLRHKMGHPEPFNMHYIGIGNEQWGPAYIERYKAFEKAIKKQYPEIIIVSGSGPFPEGDYFDYGWEALRELNAEIVASTKGEEAGAKKLKRWLQMPGWLVVTCVKSQDNDEPGKDFNNESSLAREDYAACCCAVQNLCLSLHSQGIGTKWTTGPVNFDQRFAKAVGFSPDEEYTVGTIWFGSAVVEPSTPGKKLGVEGTLTKVD